MSRSRSSRCREGPESVIFQPIGGGIMGAFRWVVIRTRPWRQLCINDFDLLFVVLPRRLRQCFTKRATIAHTAHREHDGLCTEEWINVNWLYHLHLIWLWH